MRAAIIVCLTLCAGVIQSGVAAALGIQTKGLDVDWESSPGLTTEDRSRLRRKSSWPRRTGPLEARPSVFRLEPQDAQTTA